MKRIYSSLITLGILSSALAFSPTPVVNSSVAETFNESTTRVLKADSTVKSKRTAIENGFIAELSNPRIHRSGGISSINGNIDIYRDSLFKMSGDCFEIPEINGDIYLRADSTGVLSPIWTAALPAETMADLFLLPDRRYDATKVKIKVLKHEYGVSEVVTTTVDRLIGAAQIMGCQPLWGFSKMKKGVVEGSLYLVNPQEKYIHLINITANVADLVAGKGVVEGIGNLYIPQDNIADKYGERQANKNKSRFNFSSAAKQTEVVCGRIVLNIPDKKKPSAQKDTVNLPAPVVPQKTTQAPNRKKEGESKLEKTDSGKKHNYVKREKPVKQ